MAWWAVAAAAAPYVIGALQKKPKAPEYRRPDQTPMRDQYFRAMADTAFNPNSREFQMASEVVQDQVNRALGRQGLAGSSIGGALMGNTQASMASEFMKNQQQRQLAAVQAMTAHDMNKLQMNETLAQAQYQRDQQAYQEALRRQAGVAQGIGSIAGAYAQYQGRQDDRNWYAQMVGEHGRSGMGASAALSPSFPPMNQAYSPQTMGSFYGQPAMSPYSYQSPYGMGSYGF